MAPNNKIAGLHIGDLAVAIVPCYSLPIMAGDKEINQSYHIV